ncbi:hypothetical protein [Bradyrhizobium vignae]|uniref:Uncharacterized protein n=1 Tax=Bradyrhizobium vignae TaxID=1549949 RepID=A0ABS3ZXD6_9BRAD|nr:hypothetical protein [Bradyrhizobium vignae]MBP0112809.1 hypothetical protein [Bradyrhizobium vignae]
MSRLAIAFMLALTAFAAHAHDAKSERSQPIANGTQPFLFDGRMKGDGDRQRATAKDHRSHDGTIVMPPKASELERER